jgi:hypothetical protein
MNEEFSDGTLSCPADGPGRLTAFSRVMHILFSLFFVGYGLLTDEVWLPGRRRGDIHLHGSAVVCFFLATVCAAAFLTAEVVEHYDRQGEARRYQLFRRIAGLLGWCCLGLSLSAWLYQGLSR